MKTKLKTIIKIIISGILIFLLLQQVDLKQTWQIIKDIKIINHILLISVLIIANIIHSYRWRMLLTPYQRYFSLINLFKLKLVSIYYNCILPSNFSGDFIRGYYLSKNKKNEIELSQSLSSIIIERILGFGALIFLIFIGIFYNYTILNRIKILPYLLSIFIIFLISLLFLFSKNIKNKLKKIFSSPRYQNKKLFRKIKKYYLSIHYYNKYKKIIIISFVLAIFLQGSTILINYLAFYSIGVEISIWKLFFVIPLISILNMVPVSFGNIGFREGIYVILFSYLGIGAEQSITVSLLLRFYNILLGLTGILSKNISTLKIKKQNT